MKEDGLISDFRRERGRFPCEADGNGKWNGRRVEVAQRRFPIFTEFTAACHKGAQFPSEQMKLEVQSYVNSKTFR